MASRAFCSSGTIWIAEAPVPITATRLPVRSTSWSHRAEWKTSPWKVSMPSISGSFGADSPPAPTIRVCETQVPLGGADRPALRLVVPGGVLDGGVEDEPVERPGLRRPPA